MAIFGRSFPSKSKPFGVISAPSPITEETIDNVGVASQTLTSAEAQSVSQSGSATLALTVEATAETDSTSSTMTTTLGLDAIADTESSSATGTILISDFQTEEEASSGTGSPTIAEALAETVNNSAVATIAIDEDITVPSTADDLQNSATSSQQLTESHSEGGGSSGTGDPNLAEATAEVVTNISGSPYGEGNYGDGLYGGIGSIQTIAEAIAETDNTSATATILISDFESAEEMSTGTGAPTISEALAESLTNSANNDPLLVEIIQGEGENLDNTNIGTHSIYEAIAESPQNSAVLTTLIDDLHSEEENNSGTGTLNISESIAETIDNSATATHLITEQVPDVNMTNTGAATLSISEQIAETVSSSSTSNQTFGEALAETESNSATNTPIITDLYGELVGNYGTGTPNTSESIAEFDLVEFLSTQSLDETTTVRVVPFSDISTGTWTVAPLYEKVDEILVASGYPDETIRSANNPVNDTAVLSLTPTSDPGADTDHYINVQFWRDGVDGQLDFTLNFKEGSNIIATRTFTNVTETESSPRRERIALTNLEASAIVDYSNLNVELIANEV